MKACRPGACRFEGELARGRLAPIIGRATGFAEEQLDVSLRRWRSSRSLRVITPMGLIERGANAALASPAMLSSPSAMLGITVTPSPARTMDSAVAIPATS